MKKLVTSIATTLLVVVGIVSFSGCQSEEQRQLEEIKKHRVEREKEMEKLDKLYDDAIETHKKATDSLDKSMNEMDNKLEELDKQLEDIRKLQKEKDSP